ncbi:type 1 glutamine amidotransferase domain-containing protein [Falsiroseomonas sp. CW058]|uniref:type 1 glutamine amidotransferase domain-containing protein n=1 Tax=Falsiroseomonas sp. CW058 TaxID=3388664 RepID=UPI003D32059B
MPKVLIVLTSHAALGTTGRRTGYHWEELAVPYWAFRDAGMEVLLSTLNGGSPVADPTSLAEDQADNPPAVRRFMADAAAMIAMRNTSPVGAHRSAALAGIFLPGGHGTMWDLPRSGQLANLVGAMFDAGKAVGAVCHGPAGLVAARRADGRPVVEGRRVNGFTDAEEEAVGLTDVMPFLLETRLRELGGRFEGSAPFTPHAVRDGNLVTGQNPMSSARVAELMLEAMGVAAVPKAA